MHVKGKAHPQWKVRIGDQVGMPLAQPLLLIIVEWKEWKYSGFSFLKNKKSIWQILFPFLFYYKYFLIFLVVAFKIYPSFKSGHLISKYMGFLKVSLIWISHFDINFLIKCFLFCSHTLWVFFFFSFLTLLRLSQRSLLVYVTLHLKICELFSNIFWYWFLTQFHTDKRTGSVGFQYL